MSGMKNLVYNLLVVSVISFAFCALLSALTNISYAATVSANVVANVVVPSTCYLSSNVGSINFGSVAPGTNSPWNTILYSDYAGNIGAYLWVAGTNWIYSANSAFGFYVSNTFWSPTTSGGTPLVLFPATANTGILIPANSAASTSYLVSIPPAQPASTYTQNIIGQVSC